MAAACWEQGRVCGAGFDWRAWVGVGRACSASKKAAAMKEEVGYESDEYDDFGRKRKRFRGKVVEG